MISLIVKFRYYDEAVVNQAIRFFRCQTLYHIRHCFVFYSTHLASHGLSLSSDAWVNYGQIGAIV